MAILSPPRQPKQKAKLLLGLSLLVLLSCAPARAQTVTEYQLKGEFLYRFAHFVEWPGSNASAPINICTLGSNPFGNGLERIVRSKLVNGHPLAVRHLKSPGEMDACQILFFSASESRRIGELLHSVAGQPILTVGESDAFCQKGGIIQFRVVESRLRFSINIDAASRSNLKISARLLGLATIVRDGEE